jgi:hypothetical protein
MKIILIICTLLVLSELKAQEPLNLQWATHLGGPQYDHCSGMVCGNNSIYSCGYFIGSMNGQASQGASDAFVAKYSEEGNLIWQRCFGSSSEERAQQLYYDKNSGQIFVTGYFDAKLYYGFDSLISSGEEDIFLIALDSSGNWLWGKSFGGAGAQSASAVFCDASGKISISGYFEDTLNADNIQLISRGIRNIFLIQTDANGNCLWGQRMGGLLYDEGLNIVSDEHENLYLSGYYRDTADFGPFQTRSVFTYDCFLVSLTSYGDWRWLRSFGGGYVDNCPALAYMPQSKRILTGGWFFNNMSFGSDTTLYASGEEESFLAAFDTLGNLSWSRKVGSEMAELIYDIAVDENDNILAIGTFDSIIIIGLDTLRAKHYNRPTDLFVMGFGPEGKYLWGHREGGSFSDFGYQAAWGDSSMFYLAGNFLNRTFFGTDSINAFGNYDIYLAKYFLDTLSIGPNSISSPDNQIDIKIFPNPFSDYLSVELAENLSSVQMQIFDIGGRKLKTTSILERNSRVNLSDLEMGLYLVCFYSVDAELLFSRLLYKQ